MVKADFIPEDHALCEKCKFWNICPLDYECETFKRNRITEWIEDVRDGNSTETVR